MAVKYETLATEDLDIGLGSVSKTSPAGGTMSGNKIGLHTLADGMYSVIHAGCVGDGITNDRSALNALANTTISATGGTIYFAAPYTYRIASNMTFPANVALHFAQGAKLSIDSGITVTIAGPEIKGDAQIFSGSGTVNLQTTPLVKVRWFGAKGDGSTDDSTAVQAAATVATASTGVASSGPNNNPSLYFGPGIFKLATGITISGANHGIRVIGDPFASLQNGSVRTNSVIRWTGGASAVFSVSATYTAFRGLGIENTGTATIAIDFTTGGRNDLDYMSFMGSTAFSSCILRWASGLDYTVLNHIEFDSAAPVFALVSGTSTRLKIKESVFDITSVDATIVKLNSTSAVLEQLHFADNTFNSQTDNEILALDTTAVTTGSLQNLVCIGNEIDLQSATAGDRWMKLKNVRSAIFEGNHCYANGTMTAVVNVTASTCYYLGGFLQSLNGYFFSVSDAVSNVFVVGAGYVDVTNVTGIVNPSDSVGIASYSTTGAAAVNLLGQYGNPGGITEVLISILDNSNFNVNVAAAGGGSGYFTKGQFVALRFRNSSGGAMGTASLNTGFGKVLASTITGIANGKDRVLLFCFSGTALNQVSTITADMS